MRADFVLVADASPEIGMGHAVRMQALADELVRQGQSVVFASRTLPYITERLTLPCAVEAVKDDLLPVGDALVIDAVAVKASASYNFAVHFADYSPYMQDLLVVPHPICQNQIPMRGFIGPQWMPLRRAFHPEYQRGSTSQYSKVDAVFLRADAPAEIQEAAKRLPYRLYPKWDDITSARDASIAIVTASTTAYECMALGLPTLVYPQSEKHKPIAGAMVRAGVALHWSEKNLDRLLADEGLRRSLGTRAREVVDGRGAERLASQLIRMAA